jgi:limonene-1,2-epoxide hydrolase
MPVECPDPRVAKIVSQFETLSPSNLDHLDRIYDSAVYFKDPFNEIRGLSAVQAVFEHMFRSLHEPRFLVRQAVVQGNDCFLTWDFLFRFKSRPEIGQTIHGATHLKLNGEDLITYHRDYWDAAEELYEKLPVLGALMRWLKKKSRA